MLPITKWVYMPGKRCMVGILPGVYILQNTMLGWGERMINKGNIWVQEGEKIRQN